MKKNKPEDFVHSKDGTFHFFLLVLLLWLAVSAYSYYRHKQAGELDSFWGQKVEEEQ